MFFSRVLSAGTLHLRQVRGVQAHDAAEAREGGEIASEAEQWGWDQENELNC